jgi:hypothetical protein
MARYLKDLTDDFVAYFLTNPHLVAAFNTYPGFPTDASSAATFVNSRYGASIYPFAIAEFLVKNDLSAVVDIPTRGADYHFTNHFDLFDAFFTWTCHKSLMRALAATPIADGCSESLLDRTLVVHSTEFDRSMARGLESPAGGLTIGANHGTTATFVLGGYRVNGGNMFGHRMTTPGGTLGGITGSELYFNGPLPLDPQTGQPSSSGVMYSQRALAPTVLSLFGATIPSQQVTEQRAAGFIEKKASGY